jgi:hypothetical protein
MRILRGWPAARLAFACSVCALALTTAVHGSPTLAVDVSATRVSINPDIYGIASYGLDASFAKEIQVPNVRWGGDGTSRYNWLVDSSNAGFDWYFMGGNGNTSAVPGASADLMVNTYKPANANALITIPILPYVNKSFAWSCSFPVSQYGAQQSTNPYVFPVGPNNVPQICGNGIAANGTTQLTDNDILANHIPNTTALQQGWMQHLVTTFGTAANGGVKYYQLDNEPLGWGNTHRDVMPSGATYDTVGSVPGIVQLGQQYAAVIKQVDSSALVLGPSDFTLGGWVGTPSQQGGLWAGQYYLQQMAAYDSQHGQRLLDYFDEHYYFTTASPAAQLAATRTLWDPTYNGGTWVEQYDFNGPMMLIPRFKSWITQYYPGTRLSLSEYSIDSGQKSIVDAIAEMDVLGIFGREQLDFANMWTPPAPTDPIAYAFRMFRNYDGSGHQFGDVSVRAVSSDQGSLSIYAGQRSSDNAVTVLVINKTTASISSAISFANLSLPNSAQVYTYSAANLTAITQESNAVVAAGSLSYVFPGYSAVLFVLQPSAATTTGAGSPPSSSSPPPDYSLALSANTLTASQANSGSLQVSVTPQNGFSQSVSFSCSGLPNGWACSFAPPTLAVSTTQSTTMTVSAASGAQQLARSGRMLVAVLYPLPLFMLGIVGRAVRRRQVLMFVFASVLLAGCGGDSGSTAASNSSAPQATPYTVTITSSGNSAPTHTQAFILTVSQ